MAAEPIVQTIDLNGVIYEGEPVQLELQVRPDGEAVGYFLAEDAMRARLIEGRVDAKAGSVTLWQFDQRCNLMAKIDGLLRDQTLTGTWNEPREGPPVRFQLAERPRSLRGYEGKFLCELPKGQLSSRLDLMLTNGALRQFTYLTNFTGSREATPWYCAINSLEPGFDSSADDQQVVLSETGNRSGCRVVIRDTGNLLKLRFHNCGAFCQRTAFPDLLLIDKQSGICTEVAVPHGRCPLPQ